MPSGAFRLTHSGVAATASARRASWAEEEGRNAELGSARLGLVRGKWRSGWGARCEMKAAQLVKCAAPRRPFYADAMPRRLTERQR